MYFGAIAGQPSVAASTRRRFDLAGHNAGDPTNIDSLFLRELRVELAVAVEDDPGLALLDRALDVHDAARVELDPGLDRAAGGQCRFEVAIGAAFLLEHALHGRALDRDSDGHLVARALARTLSRAGPGVGRLLRESRDSRCKECRHDNRNCSPHRCLSG